MKEDQRYIFFLPANNRAQAENSPYLEAIKSKGYEVLFMYDPFDEGNSPIMEDTNFSVWIRLILQIWDFFDTQNMRLSLKKAKKVIVHFFLDKWTFVLRKFHLRKKRILKVITFFVFARLINITPGILCNSQFGLLQLSMVFSP